MPTQSTTQKVTDLSPDGSTKFFLLADLLLQLYRKDEVVRILDVGGGSRFFQQQLKASGLQYTLTVIDIIPKPEDLAVPYIQADVTQNDLADSSFDVVLGTDVLEHVPDAKKRQFVEECLRIAKDVSIIAGPFMTNGVDKAERQVNDLNKKLFGSGQDWLEEHLELGKPRLEMFQEILERRGIAYHEFGSQNLVTWLLNTHTNLIDAKLGLDAERHVAVNRLYNTHFMSMNEFQEPTYRRFIVMYKNAKKAGLVKPEKYKTTPIDGDKIAEYTSEVIDLYANRIIDLTAQRADMQREKEAIEAHSRRLDKLREAHEKTIAEQSATLQKLEPLLRIAKSGPVRAIRRLHKRKNSR
jgi:predicted HTH domain antitoxin